MYTRTYTCVHWMHANICTYMYMKERKMETSEEIHLWIVGYNLINNTISGEIFAKIVILDKRAIYLKLCNPIASAYNRFILANYKFWTWENELSFFRSVCLDVLLYCSISSYFIIDNDNNAYVLRWLTVNHLETQVLMTYSLYNHDPHSTISNEETFLEYFPLILKRMLQY